MRTIIDLHEDQLEALDRLCRQENISRAEAVRRAVDEHVRRHRASEGTRAFGIWRGRRLDGLTFERRLRKEWDRVKALFDTNVLIDYLAGREAADAELSRHRDRLVSVVTCMELLAGARHAEEEDIIETFLRDFRIVDITREIAREAVGLRKSHRLRLPDAIIWASARVESALLVTRNTKDFAPDEPGVRVPY